MTCGLVHVSYSLPEWQAVKLTFFAPWWLTLPNVIMSKFSLQNCKSSECYDTWCWFCFVFFHQFSTRPTLYIGEHAGGLYALPSLIEEGSPLVEVNIQLFLANNHNIHWFLGCFHSNTLMVPLQGLKKISLFRKGPNHRSNHSLRSKRFLARFV